MSRARLGLAATLIALLGLSGAVALGRELPPGGTFVDDDGNIHEPAIEAIAAAGITAGCNPPRNDEYCPGDPVTRGQMAAFLVRALGYTDDGGGDRFTDDDDSVFEADIDKLATAEVTLGCNPPDNDHYCPNDLVLRDQMASFLARALDLAPIVPPPPGSSTSTIPGSTTTTTPGDECVGTIGAITVEVLTVPAGATCTLEGTVVEGDLKVFGDATLQSVDAIIAGNLIAVGHALVDVSGGSVGGRAEVEQGGVANVSGVTVGGNLDFSLNEGVVSADSNTVTLTLGASDNTGGVTITSNSIGGDLQCRDNVPPPIFSDNTVGGEAKDQCLDL